jgi:hypothetical protein
MRPVQPREGEHPSMSSAVGGAERLGRVDARAAARSRPLSRWLAVPRAPLYPPLVTLAFVLFDYAASNVLLEALWRPLLVALVITILLQLALGALLRGADAGAFVVLMLQFALLGLPAVTLVLGAWLVAGIAIAIHRRRGLKHVPWRRATRVLNAVAIVLLAQVIVTTALGGGLAFGRSSWSIAQGTPAADAPDVYLLLLDGYPRGDTLQTRFGFDNAPFLSSMESMGFDVATNARSNYDVTVLTLASMLNGEQIATLIPNPPDARPEQFRELTRLINQGTDLQRFRQAGYEIVSVPSEYYEGTVVDADRNLDTGELSSFEMQLLQTGYLRTAFGGVMKTALPEQHRERVFHQFDSLEGLAAERGRGPKVVLTHLLVPHMPLAFNRDGSAAPGLSCFPMSCTLFTYGDQYRADTIAAMDDQVAWLNDRVEGVVRDIQAKSSRPPVIVIFSDHGTRFWSEDRAEMYRSLFLAATPGHSGLFPDDTTPVNVLTRLLNAYTGSSYPLASEELYWLDTRHVDASGVLGPSLTKIEPGDPLDG